MHVARQRTLAIAAILVAGPLLLAGGSTAREQASENPDLEAAGKTAAALCGSCHVVPPPDVLPRDRWRDNVTTMFLMLNRRPVPFGQLGTSVRKVELPPEWNSVASYYEARAPERLPDPETWPPPAPTLPFRKLHLKPGGGAAHPYISHVRFVDVDGDGRLEIVATDMRHGSVLVGRPYAPATPLSTIAELLNPAHIQPTDLDGDGAVDFLVADLGTFFPSDEERGSVVWLRRRGNDGYAALTLDGWPRVSDVQAADFDGDGRPDLAVAAFGWRAVGNLSILRNQTTSYEQPSFARVPLDARTGAIHATPVDFNGDGRPDLVTLFAQEHETVVAFINNGPGIAFEPRTLYTAPHPHWGSSGIQVVDLDSDGDLDVLLTHGDMMDDGLLKPYHGIHWLENRGSVPFVARRLASMPGVLRAQAADLDGDGDLDVVASALVPLDDAATSGLPALVWLEQTARGVFMPHTLKLGMPRHPTLDLGDFDRDGDIDIAVGHMPGTGTASMWIEIWENLRRGPGDGERRSTPPPGGSGNR